MPSKKKKYNARFPAGRIKKIMQTDDEVGKVAQAVPVIISRTLELFVESLLTKAQEITSAKNAKTLSPSHMKQCILSESRFDFLKELVASLPDVVTSDYDEAVMSPQIGSTNSGDVPRSYSRRAEKQTPNPVPAKETPDGSLRASFAATSSTVVADFYKETLNNTNSSGSASSGFNNAKDLVPNEKEDLDEDYDTT